MRARGLPLDCRAWYYLRVAHVNYLHERGLLEDAERECLAAVRLGEDVVFTRGQDLVSDSREVDPRCVVGRPWIAQLMVRARDDCEARTRHRLASLQKLLRKRACEWPEGQTFAAAAATGEPFIATK